MYPIRHTQDTALEVGIDEAGRGCLWGPLCAGAVIWVPEEDMSEEQRNIASKIRDSKKVTAKRRKELSGAIQDLAVSWAVGMVSAAEIDSIGMTKANQLAFRRALEGLDVEPDRLLIDGLLSLYDQPWSMKEQIVEPELDGKFLPVAAASVLAKVAHDEWVEAWCDTNGNLAEKYDLRSCKGYGTAKHRAGILQWGETTEHRRLFLRKLWAGKEVEDTAELREV